MSYSSTVGKFYKNMAAPINLFKKNGNQDAALKRAAQYGTAGFSIGGPVGAAIGGGIGYVAGLFEKDPDEILRERRDAMVKSINEERTKRISNIERTTSNQRMADQQGAGYRAIASGRDPQNAEDSYLVANQRSAENQNRALENANQVFDSQINQVNAEYESRPVQPSLGDVLLESGMSIAGTVQQNELMDLRKEYLDAYSKNALAKAGDGLPKSDPIIPDLSMQTPSFDPGVPEVQDTQVFQPEQPIDMSIGNQGSAQTSIPLRKATGNTEPMQVNNTVAPQQDQVKAVAKAYSFEKDPNNFQSRVNMMSSTSMPNNILIDQMELPKSSRNLRVGKIFRDRMERGEDVLSMKNWAR